MTGLVNEGRAVIVVYVDFGKTFSTVSYGIPIDTWMKYKLAS